MRKKCRELAQEHQIYILTNSVESVHTDRMQRSLIAPYVKESFVSECVGYENRISSILIMYWSISRASRGTTAC